MTAPTESESKGIEVHFICTRRELSWMDVTERQTRRVQWTLETELKDFLFKFNKRRKNFIHFM